MLEAQSRRIAQLEAHLDELSATSDELQAQFLKLRRDTLLAAAEGLAH
jgi:cell division protein FtsB